MFGECSVNGSHSQRAKWNCARIETPGKDIGLLFVHISPFLAIYMEEYILYIWSKIQIKIQICRHKHRITIERDTWL